MSVLDKLGLDIVCVLCDQLGLDATTVTGVRCQTERDVDILALASRPLTDVRFLVSFGARGLPEMTEAEAEPTHQVNYKIHIDGDGVSREPDEP